MSFSGRPDSSQTTYLLKRAAPLIEVPYLPTGADLAGWDCRGCVQWVRREFFGLDSPGMGTPYTAQQSASLADVERMILANLAAWRPVEVRPGAVLLIHWFGRSAHVGCYLGGGEFIHALAGHGTSIVPLTRWSRKVRGAYEIAD